MNVLRCQYIRLTNDFVRQHSFQIKLKVINILNTLSNETAEHGACQSDLKLTPFENKSTFNNFHLKHSEANDKATTLITKCFFQHAIDEVALENKLMSNVICKQDVNY
ncbi:CLUMA_CG011841, isoform A [Clunio marinus]|uniref:CLUMA_CG011841, isoform A n=1 Tax=Clunio marinus TaxID=568069 RepID=A0A1J1IG24_9DIPT|nr:CLUMA_CG011841, isoform A [Clunio marinus]